MGRFVNQNFQENLLPNFQNQRFKKVIENDESGGSIRLNLYDLVTVESSHELKQADFVGLVYDGSKRETFRTIEIYLDKAKQQTTENTKFYLIENKCDLTTDPGLSTQPIDLAEKYAIDLRRVSAKTGEGVDNLFYE